MIAAIFSASICPAPRHCGRTFSMISARRSWRGAPLLSRMGLASGLQACLLRAGSCASATWRGSRVGPRTLCRTMSGSCAAQALPPVAGRARWCSTSSPSRAQPCSRASCRQRLCRGLPSEVAAAAPAERFARSGRAPGCPLPRRGDGLRLLRAHARTRRGWIGWRARARVSFGSASMELWVTHPSTPSWQR